MTSTEILSVVDNHPSLHKRKRDNDEEELEINLDAPEPPSKKALRKAKKQNTEGLSNALARASGVTVQKSEDAVPNQAKRSEYGIWIGNLSFTTTKQDLLTFLTTDSDHVMQQDAITRINLPAGPPKYGKPQNKGFAYIDLKDNETLQTALEFSEKLLGGRRVLVKNAKSFEGRPAGSGKEVPSNPPSKRIFIGNLDFETTADDLEEFFGVCGSIQHTQIATFEDSGKCKGYAWIEFDDLSSAQAAMRGWVEKAIEPVNSSTTVSKRRVWLNKMNGRKLRMEFAEDKTTRYNKRFGKKASQNNQTDTAPPVQETTDLESTPEQATRSKINNRHNGSSDAGKDLKQRSSRKGYTQETVTRLTGGIVESQGQKVTFE